MKFEVGDLVYISHIGSLYRITAVHEKDKTYNVSWLGNGDKNIPQVNATHESVFVFYRKPSKLEKALT